MGVDVGQSVQRIGGKVAVYFKLLDRFRSVECDAVSQIQKAIAAEDFKVAERRAHTLKGIAGTLGAETLQNQAALVEDSIRGGVLDGLDDLLSELDRSLNALLDSIDQAFRLRD